VVHLCAGESLRLCHCRFLLDGQGTRGATRFSDLGCGESTRLSRNGGVTDKSRRFAHFAFEGSSSGVVRFPTPVHWPHPRSRRFCPSNPQREVDSLSAHPENPVRVLDDSVVHGTASSSANGTLSCGIPRQIHALAAVCPAAPLFVRGGVVGEIIGVGGWVVRGRRAASGGAN